MFLDDVRPQRAARGGVFRRAVGECDVGELLKDVLVERQCMLELAKKTSDRLAVTEKRGKGSIPCCREKWHAHIPCHPDGKVRHDPPGAVLRQNDDA